MDHAVQFAINTPSLYAFPPPPTPTPPSPIPPTPPFQLTSIPLLAPPALKGRRPASRPVLMPICTMAVVANHPYPRHDTPTRCSPRSPLTPRSPRFPPVSEILPRLYLGDLAAAESASVHAALGITHVLSAMRGPVTLPASFPRAPAAHMHLALIDNPFAELLAHLPAAVAFISAALADPAATVLVHCVQGISRSVSVVTAYLVARFGWPAARALDFVRERRKVADPNFGFIKQLEEFERNLGGRGV